MKNLSRREFLNRSIAATAALAGGASILGNVQASHAVSKKIGLAKLGKSGVMVSRLAFGTGTHGWKHSSDQTRIGQQAFIDLVQHAYGSGVTFMDAADIYGSHTYLREALKYVPREKLVIMSKIWTSGNDWLKVEDVPTTLDRFRKEMGVEYIDIVLIHCQTQPDWPEKLQKMRDELSEAKQKGMIRTHGVSCHSLPALKAAAASDWVEVLLSRINPAGSHMDDKPEVVMPVLKQAHDSGKGVIGMKIFGEGDLVSEERREASLQYVWGSGNVDAMTIGMISGEQMNDNIRRVNRILAG